MTLPINQPFPLFADRDGSPLSQGYIYIGTAGANPETNDIQAYWDDAMTIPAAQPLRTINGYIVRNGSPSAVYVNANSFSCTVKDRARNTIVYAASVASSSLASVNAAAASAAAAAASEAAAAASAVAAASAASGILTQAQLEDYLGKIRVPIGMVMPFADDVVPYGYLECNGAAVSRTSYAPLFAIIGTTFGVGDGATTFNLPDLRAYFVRGWDHGRGVDAARVFGSSQTDAFQNFTGTLVSNSVGAVSGAFAYSSIGSGSVVGAGNTYGTYTLNPSTVARTAAETRPHNVALMYCIKAFDAALAQTPPLVLVTEATTARTLVLSDQSKYINCTNAAAVTITVPANATVAFPVDTEVTVFQDGAGVVSFVAAGGVTIKSAGLSITAQYKAATLKKVATDTWHLIGAV